MARCKHCGSEFLITVGIVFGGELHEEYGSSSACYLALKQRVEELLRELSARHCSIDMRDQPPCPLQPRADTTECPTHEGVMCSWKDERKAIRKCKDHDCLELVCGLEHHERCSRHPQTPRT